MKKLKPTSKVKDEILVFEIQIKPNSPNVGPAHVQPLIRIMNRSPNFRLDEASNLPATTGLRSGRSVLRKHLVSQNSEAFNRPFL